MNVHIVGVFIGQRPDIDTDLRIDLPVFFPLRGPLAAKEKSRSNIEHGKSRVHVIEEHQRRRCGGLVFNPVFDPERRLAQNRRDPSRQFQVGTEYDSLTHCAGHFEQIVLPIPEAAGTDLTGGRVGNPPVQPQRLVLLFGIGFGMPYEGHATSRKQPAEKPSQPSEPLRFIEAWPDVARAAAKPQ